jgi:multidrug transporter EmrE-like cation transporter
VQVSLAYPFVGLGFVLTMLLGWAIHGDSLSVARVAGTLIISLGVVILARS